MPIVSWFHPFLASIILQFCQLRAALGEKMTGLEGYGTGMPGMHGPHGAWLFADPIPRPLVRDLCEALKHLHVRRLTGYRVSQD